MSKYTTAFYYLFTIYLFIFLLFRAVLAAYGSSQAGVKSELQPLAYSTATATPDPSHICNLHHSSWQRWIINPLSKGRDRTRNFMVPSRIR